MDLFWLRLHLTCSVQHSHFGDLSPDLRSALDMLHPTPPTGTQRIEAAVTDDKAGPVGKPIQHSSGTSLSLLECPYSYYCSDCCDAFILHSLMGADILSRCVLQSHSPGIKQVLGSAQYTTDIPPRNRELKAALVVSSIPHGKILSIGEYFLFFSLADFEMPQELWSSLVSPRFILAKVLIHCPILIPRCSWGQQDW